MVFKKKKKKVEDEFDEEEQEEEEEESEEETEENDDLAGKNPKSVPTKQKPKPLNQQEIFDTAEASILRGVELLRYGRTIK